ncbi:MAG: hypothetical protein ACO2Z6_09015, partial [Pseudohongiellaceae bacterium]
PIFSSLPDRTSSCHVLSDFSHLYTRHTRHYAHQALHPATPCWGLWFALIGIRSPYLARDPLG